MNTLSAKEKFQKLVNECVSEIRNENNPILTIKEALRPIVKRVLNELSTAPNQKVDKDELEKERKGYAKKGNERLDKTNEKLLKELETLVHGIDNNWCVYWDDRNDLVVDAKSLLKVRITPKFENNFDIDAMPKLVDRIRVIAVTWEQVKTFIKANFTDLKNKTSVDNAKEKSDGNEISKKENDGKAAGPIQSDIKNRGEKNNGEDSKVKSTKKDNKDYNELPVKDEDLPDQPMRPSELKNLNKKIDKTPQVKPPKLKKDDGADKLKHELPSTKKFKVKKQ